jgi:hypothetical protein
VYQPTAASADMYVYIYIFKYLVHTYRILWYV